MQSSKPSRQALDPGGDARPRRYTLVGQAVEAPQLGPRPVARSRSLGEFARDRGRARHQIGCAEDFQRPHGHAAPSATEVDSLLRAALTKDDHGAP